jgi:superoxide dismutase, Fe-Mn family
MTIDAPKLPYPEDALEPHMSAHTVGIHYNKHHLGYVRKANDLIKGTPLAEKSLEAIMVELAGDADAKAVKIFNNAAQVWNHSFFWNCMSPDGGGRPSGELEALLTAGFGGLDGFKAEFKKAAVEHFGSGYAWLIRGDDGLSIETMPNAMNPLAKGKVALLGCDLWEHAYYLDHQNARDAFLTAFLDKLVNWNFVASQLKRDVKVVMPRQARRA